MRQKTKAVSHADRRSSTFWLLSDDLWLRGSASETLAPYAKYAAASVDGRPSTARPTCMLPAAATWRITMQ